MNYWTQSTLKTQHKSESKRETIDVYIEKNESIF